MMKFKFLHPSLAAAFALAVFLCAPQGAQSAEEASKVQIELTANQLYSTWDNINGALTVVAASTSMDDDWTEMFKTMAPDPASGKTLADLVAELQVFKTKLDVVRAESEMDPVALTATNLESLSGVFLASGQIMDELILVLNYTDPLAFIAQYYLWKDEGEKSMNDAFAMAALANKRMDVYMEENGIEMPEAGAEGDGESGENAGNGG